MVNAYSFDGLLVLLLLFICTSAYLRRVPRLKQMLLSEKSGIFGTFYKASVIGLRLHWIVSLCCVSMVVYLMILK